MLVKVTFGPIQFTASGRTQSENCVCRRTTIGRDDDHSTTAPLLSTPPTTLPVSVNKQEESTTRPTTENSVIRRAAADDDEDDDEDEGKHPVKKQFDTTRVGDDEDGVNTTCTSEFVGVPEGESEPQSSNSQYASSIER
ncbi:hypothetical protein BLNAU_18229 [Blattamonas nauphoetae]|uniref:Uncharacterized protein n=1 Tax=Blattamonas nauphoetae TaxID=2049346 RepID=A0ABQ9X513_9EUKA|nr:hypothetical protein BLNAU_18229 [Blattamonas nauphoetae]